jgi:hypothetical protein
MAYGSEMEKNPDLSLNDIIRQNTAGYYYKDLIYNKKVGFFLPLRIQTLKFYTSSRELGLRTGTCAAPSE